MCCNYVKMCSCNYRIQQKGESELFIAEIFMVLIKCILGYIMVWKGNMIDS